MFLEFNKEQQVTYLDLAGYTASALFITAYYFNSKETCIDKTYKFQLINIIAGIMSAIYSYKHGAQASVITNIIWVMITLNSLKPLITRKLRLLSTTKQGDKNEKVSSISFMYRH